MSRMLAALFILGVAWGFPRSISDKTIITICIVGVPFNLYCFSSEPVHAHPHEPDSVTLKMEAVCSSET
jgi:hypothetical protein